MRDGEKNKEQLARELAEVRQRVFELETAEAEIKKIQGDRINVKVS